MYDNMQKLAALPDETAVYCAHEYTLSNARFAVTIEPDNAALAARYAEVQAMREHGEPTVPTSIGAEKATNPFMRAASVEELAARRTAKDNF
jgi:hydroxyacylglutathione hydrolase